MQAKQIFWVLHRQSCQVYPEPYSFLWDYPDHPRHHQRLLLQGLPSKLGWTQTKPPQLSHLNFEPTEKENQERLRAIVRVVQTPWI